MHAPRATIPRKLPVFRAPSAKIPRELREIRAPRATIPRKLHGVRAPKAAVPRKLRCGRAPRATIPRKLRCVRTPRAPWGILGRPGSWKSPKQAFRSRHPQQILQNKRFARDIRNKRNISLDLVTHHAEFQKPARRSRHPEHVNLLALFDIACHRRKNPPALFEHGTGDRFTY